MALVTDKRSLLRCLLPGAVALLCATSAFGQSIRFTGDGVVVHLDSEVLYTFVRYQNRPGVWNEVFPVRVNGAQRNISGKYEIGDSTVTFVPAFPFAQGVDYEAIFYSAELALNPNEVYLPRMNASTLELKFKLEKPASDPPKVVNIFPTANELPENLLRFHIEFSSSMTQGEVIRRVHLVDEEGKEVEKALLVLDEELWDEDMRLVTVLLDPGRIKRGLRANLEMKAPLIAGKKYSLVVDPGWRNSEGEVTASQAVKTFSCYAADRERPVTSVWRLVAPATAVDPLVIEAEETYDAVSLQNALVVTDALGNRVNGKITASERESVIYFTPDRPWSKEKYTVVVNPKLEDVAGNNLVRLFDTDITEKQHQANQPTTFSFAVHAGLPE